MHAIILAGGFGTRLRTAVSDVPKPLAPIGRRPFLAWLLDYLARQGVTSVTLSVHHQWEKIHAYFTDHPPLPLLDFAVEPTPLGTGGAIGYALSRYDGSKPVLILNGDTFVQVDYQKLYAAHTGPLTMVLRHVPDTGRYGEALEQAGTLTGFRPGTPGKPGFINAGIYVVSPNIFTGYDLPEAFSFEKDFLEPHVAALRPRAHIADGYFIDIGIPEDYERACKELPNL